MDALTAGIIVALISVLVFIVVALITARSRIGMLPAKAILNSSNPTHLPTDLPESAEKFRLLGWFIVVLLYLIAIFCVLQGLNNLRVVLHWDQWKAYFGNLLTDRAEIALYSRFWIVEGIALFFIGYWAQRRLRRRCT
jgi:hypothetical protein